MRTKFFYPPDRRIVRDAVCFHTHLRSNLNYKVLKIEFIILNCAMVFTTHDIQRCALLWLAVGALLPHILLSQTRRYEQVSSFKENSISVQVSNFEECVICYDAAHLYSRLLCACYCCIFVLLFLSPVQVLIIFTYFQFRSKLTCLDSIFSFQDYIF